MERNTSPGIEPAQEDRPEVVRRLMKSARLMEIQMDMLYKQKSYIQAECQFQMINGIYSRISSQEYKAYFTC